MNEFQARIGVGKKQSNYHRHKGTTKTTRVTAQEGSLSGVAVGTQTEHWNDRVDGKVSGGTTHINQKAFRTRKEEL